MVVKAQIYRGKADQGVHLRSPKTRQTGPTEDPQWRVVRERKWVQGPAGDAAGPCNSTCIDSMQTGIMPCASF
jgi:hypothetical protein